MNLLKNSLIIFGFTSSAFSFGSTTCTPYQTNRNIAAKLLCVQEGNVKGKFHLPQLIDGEGTAWDIAPGWTPGNRTYRICKLFGYADSDDHKITTGPCKTDSNTVSLGGLFNLRSIYEPSTCITQFQCK